MNMLNEKNISICIAGGSEYKPRFSNRLQRKDFGANSVVFSKQKVSKIDYEVTVYTYFPGFPVFVLMASLWQSLVTVGRMAPMW